LTRRTLSRLARTRVFDAGSGRCHLCGLKIHAERGEPWQVEHRKPLWEGGADDESNMSPAHVHCHAKKTAGEAPVKAKTDRVRAKHLGIKKTPSFRGWQTFKRKPVKNPHYGKPQP
jgi:5-methylcytosine-specific restriction protein A